MSIGQSFTLPCMHQPDTNKGEKILTFSLPLAKEVASKHSNKSKSEIGLVESFSQICNYLADNPESLSWKGKLKPSVHTREGLDKLAERYFASYRKSDFPAKPGTVPDEMVSIVMQVAYGYTDEQSQKIKIEHQYSMCAENCVGALLERYLDSILRSEGWHWSCGDFVKAIDFIRKNENGTWVALQIKNRNNSENSSSSSVRNGTLIQKWFRSFSRRKATNWDKLPENMSGYSLSEKSFIAFAKTYLLTEKKMKEQQQK
jgi:SinI restriction endonuclease